MNHSTALLSCQKYGWRLCTLDEVKSLCNGIGCFLDSRQIWTSTECVASYVVVRSDTDEEECRYPNETGFVCKILKYRIVCDMLYSWHSLSSA